MQKVILIIMDGWGIAPPSKGNIISKANIPNIENIEKYYPAAILHASGINVGVPWWEEGNSEVGHLTIGCGQIIYQYLPRIISSIQTGSFQKINAFLGANEHVKKEKSRLHLMGLVSSGAIHSYIDHLYALLEFCKNKKIQDVYLHIFTDGRDSLQTEGKVFIQNLKQRIDIQQTGKIATIGGRSFGMDRNKNWERTQKAYNCITQGKGEKAQDPIAYLKASYNQKITDEYIEPSVVDPAGIIKNNDAVIFFNFREDRARQITSALIKDDFKEFPRKKIKNLYFAGMTKYLEDTTMNVAFQPPKIEKTLGKIISDHGFRQFRIAETEKYAHVTYFFNGLKEKQFLGEERTIIPSIGGPHYDRFPKMQATKIKEKVIKEVKQGKYHFILINFANGDMIGHTGNMEAAKKAVEEVDECVGEIAQAAKGKYITMITSDHGNVEEMIDRKGQIISKHSANPVPFYLIDPSLKKSIKRDKALNRSGKANGSLFDIAPTILEYLEIPKPKEMTGLSLTKNII